MTKQAVLCDLSSHISRALQFMERVAMRQLAAFAFAVQKLVSMTCE